MRTNEGHRQRVKDRYIKEGLDSFEESHVLELLLFYTIPRRDTKPVARRLLDRFGSFAGVLEARIDALCQVEGVGLHTAVFLKLLNDTGRYYLTSKERDEVVLDTLDRCGDYLRNLFYGQRNESIWLVCMDARCKLLNCQKISEGNLVSSSVNARQIMEQALAVNAHSVILAHNHPGGYAFPSDADVAMTQRLATALKAMDLLLVDHFIVTDQDCVSMRQGHYFDPDRIRYLG